MIGWQIHEYGGIELLQCNEHIKIPTVNSPNDVLVEVRAASVNPIDVAMMGMISLLRHCNYVQKLNLFLPIHRRIWCNFIKRIALQ